MYVIMLYMSQYSVLFCFPWLLGNNKGSSRDAPKMGIKNLLKGIKGKHKAGASGDRGPEVGGSQDCSS